LSEKRKIDFIRNQKWTKQAGESLRINDHRW